MNESVDVGKNLLREIPTEMGELRELEVLWTLWTREEPSRERE